MFVLFFGAEFPNQIERKIAKLFVLRVDRWFRLQPGRSKLNLERKQHGTGNVWLVGQHFYKTLSNYSVVYVWCVTVGLAAISAVWTSDVLVEESLRDSNFTNFLCLWKTELSAATVRPYSTKPQKLQSSWRCFRSQPNGSPTELNLYSCTGEWLNRSGVFISCWLIEDVQWENCWVIIPSVNNSNLAIKRLKTKNNLFWARCN